MLDNNLVSVFRYELKRNFNRRGFLFTTFGLPVIGVAVFFLIQLIAGGDASAGPGQLQDFDFELEAIEQAGYVDQSGLFSEPGDLAAEVLRRYEDEDAARAALNKGEIDVFYVLNEDYPQSGAVQMYMPSFMPSFFTDGPVRQLFFSQLLESGADRELVSRLVNPANIQATALQRADATPEANQLDEGQNTTVVNIFAILFVLAIFGTNGYLMQTVIEEKETRLMEILISSVRPFQLLVGKILALGLLGLFQIAIYVGTVVAVATFATDTGTFLDNLNIPTGLFITAFVYFILGYLMFAAVFGAVGAISTSIQEGPNLATFFILPAMLPLFLNFVIAEEPMGTLARVLSYVPLTSPMTMIMRSSISDVPSIDYIISVVLLAIIIGGMMWMAGRLFRVQALLAGQMPKLREIPALIFSRE